MERWASRLPSGASISVRYRFQLTESGTGTKEVNVPIGNGFERLFLKLLRKPNSRKVSVCVDSDDPAPNFNTTAEVIEVEIDAGPVCVNTNTSIIARR